MGNLDGTTRYAQPLVGDQLDCWSHAQLLLNVQPLVADLLALNIPASFLERGHSQPTGVIEALLLHGHD